MAMEDQEQIDLDRALENFDEEELQEGGSDEDSQQAAIWEYEEQYGRVCNDAQSVNDDLNDYESDGSGDDGASELSHGRQDNGGDYCAHAVDYDDISLGSDNAPTFSEDEISNNSDDCFSYCTEFR